MLTDLEKKIITLLQTDIPVVKRPFLEMAQKIGITEDEFLAVLNKLNDQGMIRRFGATLKHQKSGFKANAMVAWKVDEDQVEDTGNIMAGFQEITHCYRRNPAPGWKYNLYTMVHAATEDECYDIAQKISKATGQDEYELLFSRKELKKTSMKYFED
ncbi:MAG: Lrp/AsnC family transcriptional regulator [Proteobacteria bacterium]|nr:Lrp/AsnC family transcriptional regulator [Pseudomonadota bacterium]MBU1388699.1 Lrp/AsnC family transcriptional regulator [Pseudomonadota bacterium]MBU1541909.1 Lrp/AsnC family transcriptional regulator [Pseudomonadota bacterium]MBU2431560.1 Lrp/AsnC family transcriptional regulator [Pseudomonadota bacterium]MBU2480865.1 Lrp/AsnC family transcriptional regulator [Pseudomonadota bacterium]